MKEHLRAWLGEPVEVRRISLGQSGYVSILQVGDAPCKGAITMATAGLSKVINHRLHEELLFACWSDSPLGEMASILEFLVRQLAAGREPLMPGDVVGPAGPLVTGTSMEALYVCDPVYFQQGFSHFLSSSGCEIRLRWLVPIYANEARTVDSKGASALDDMFVDQDPDLLSLQRGPVLD